MKSTAKVRISERRAKGKPFSFYSSEQNPANIKKFGQEMLQNTHNIIRIPGGKGSLHAKISGHYFSKPQDLHGLTVRQWLSTKSFEEQYEYGIKMLKKYGWE